MLVVSVVYEVWLKRVYRIGFVMKKLRVAVLPLIWAGVLLCTFSSNGFAQPLKVFILAGQSNMEGHAEIRTFDYIGKDRHGTFAQEMRNPDGTPAYVIKSGCLFNRTL